MRSGIYSYPNTQRVIFGTTFEQAISKELETIGAQRVYVLSSGSLYRETEVVNQLKTVLGSRCVGLFHEMPAHTPRIPVVKAAQEAQHAQADLILTLGGGSMTDAGKMVTLCMSNGIESAQDLDRLATKVHADGRIERPEFQPPTVPCCVISTTLSAGEFSALAGCTDTVRGMKENFLHPKASPRSVILDPALTLHTPEWLWLSTGIRAVDHAVEDLCSINTQPISEATSFQALRLLGRGLRAVKKDPADLEARLDCQLGAWMSIIGSSAGVQKGASHGIGHILGGTAGVPHGYTSCVMLPHVLRFNQSINGAQQKLVSEALGEPHKPACDVVSDLVAQLGLPSTLREVGVKADMLDLIAQNSMHDRLIHSNPRKIHGPEDVRRILEAAW
ncbi:MAG: iron-containing alcohol dehydrogenase [Betaproteobacteria bacterium]|jgi:maleylacetate reductase